jgi:protein TonB
MAVAVNAQIVWEVGLIDPHDWHEGITQPSFPGGDEAMMKYIHTNITYPKTATENTIEGVVYVELTVWSDGSIASSRIRRGIGHGCDEEVLRVIQEMPHWRPATIAGKPVAIRCTIPVNFSLPESTDNYSTAANL